MSDNIDEIEGIDDLGEMVDLELGFGGEVLPEKNNKIALIDADTVAFTSCLSAEEETTEFNEETQEHEVVWVIDIMSALDIAEEKIKRILDRTGCLSAELHFTSGRENFRYAIFPDYKANRTGDKAQRTPAGLLAVKEALMERYSGSMSTKWEADDIVVYKKTQEPEKYILCAIDKDVLKCIPGKHFNYYESRHFNKDMAFMEVTEGEARMWPYMQCILGDKSDNIPGCNGIGPKKAIKFVNDAMTHEELWDGVVRAWESKGQTEEAAILTMQLVNMHCLVDADGLTIKLWQPLERDENE